MSYKTVNCPRCGSLIECKADSIRHCHCSQVSLTAVELDFIRTQFMDCLCNDCLEDLKLEFQSHRAGYRIEH